MLAFLLTLHNAMLSTCKTIWALVGFNVEIITQEEAYWNMLKIVECVPNFSEGRDPAVIEALVALAKKRADFVNTQTIRADLVVRD